MYGWGNTSGRTESSCPSLMYAGPSSINVFTAFWACLRYASGWTSLPSARRISRLSRLYRIAIGVSFHITPRNLRVSGFIRGMADLLKESSLYPAQKMTEREKNEEKAQGISQRRHFHVFRFASQQ